MPIDDSYHSQCRTMLVDLNVWEGKGGRLMSALISNSVAQGLPGCNTESDGILYSDRYEDMSGHKIGFPGDVFTKICVVPTHTHNRKWGGCRFIGGVGACHNNFGVLIL